MDLPPAPGRPNAAQRRSHTAASRQLGGRVGEGLSRPLWRDVVPKRPCERGGTDETQEFQEPPLTRSRSVTETRTSFLFVYPD